MKALEGRQISFSYAGGKTLFSQVNVHVKNGECVILRGPSGSGKTTLCNILAGIIPRSISGELRGDVLLFGENLRTLSLATVVQKVGILFQNPDSQLFFPTVEDEIAFGPENLCLSREEIGLRIEQALDTVQMGSYRLMETETKKNWDMPFLWWKTARNIYTLWTVSMNSKTDRRGRWSCDCSHSPF